MPDTYYRRYTDIPSLVQVLTNRQITLLDPSSWDDKNDSFFLTTYKEKKGLKSVLALCFTSAPETYHHWRVFSPGSSGVCIHFNGASLRSAFHKVDGVKFKEVDYVKLNDLRRKIPATNELPFIKRFPFQPEKEYRALWESKVKACAALDIAIELTSISRITLSPWLHPDLRKNLVAALKRIEGCKGLPMWRSTLIENATWKDYGSSAT